MTYEVWCLALLLACYVKRTRIHIISVSRMQFDYSTDDMNRTFVRATTSILVPQFALFLSFMHSKRNIPMQVETCIIWTAAFRLLTFTFVEAPENSLAVD